MVSASLRIWAWLPIGHTQNEGMAAPRALFVRILEITTGCT